MMIRKDFEIGSYQTIKAPIVLLSEKTNKISFQQQIHRNIFLQLLSNKQLKLIETRINNLKRNLPYIYSHIYNKYPNLEILHISVGGSYGYNPNSKIRDIDFNIIVKGSFFAYYDVFNIDELKQNLNTSICKISFMIFGEDNLKGVKKIDDSILSKSFLHTDMTIREGIVMYVRNVLIDGQDFCNVPTNIYNFKMRIKRQLFQAHLLLEGVIGTEYGTIGRYQKAFSRIKEAGILLSINTPKIYYWGNLDFNFSEVKPLYKAILKEMEKK